MYINEKTRKVFIGGRCFLKCNDISTTPNEINLIPVSEIEYFVENLDHNTTIHHNAFGEHYAVTVLESMEELIRLLEDKEQKREPKDPKGRIEEKHEKENKDSWPWRDN